MRRAALSILSNIAEGFERDSDAEFVRFLYIAKGSCGELRAQVLVALDQKYLVQAVFDDLTACCRRISGSLSNLIAYRRKSSPAKRRT
jgi:four helix bundle protein